MSAVSADDYRVRYLGPWTWREPGDRGGWAFPRRRFGWRIVVEANGGRFEAQGCTLAQLVGSLRDAIDFRLPMHPDANSDPR